jgi:hypothetical protein
MQFHIVLHERDCGQLLSNEAFNGGTRRFWHDDVQGHLTFELSGAHADV